MARAMRIIDASNINVMDAREGAVSAASTIVSVIDVVLHEGALLGTFHLRTVVVSMTWVASSARLCAAVNLPLRLEGR